MTNVERRRRIIKRAAMFCAGATALLAISLVSLLKMDKSTTLSGNARFNQNVTRNINQSDYIDCILSKSHGLPSPFPDDELSSTSLWSSLSLEPKWLCVTNEEFAYELTGDMTSFSRDNSIMMKRETKLLIPQNIIQGYSDGGDDDEDAGFDQFVDLDSPDASSIRVVVNNFSFFTRSLVDADVEQDRKDDDEDDDDDDDEDDDDEYYDDVSAYYHDDGEGDDGAYYDDDGEGDDGAYYDDDGEGDDGTYYDDDGEGNDGTYYDDDGWEYDAFKGDFKVLVIRVEDTHGNNVAQSEATLFHDFFEDENNLRKRFADCSNNKLRFEPATGLAVSDGVLTVELQTDIKNKRWFSVRNQVMRNVYPMIGNTIDEDVHYISIVMPNTVDFDGAVAWAGYPSRISCFKSLVASLPMVQSHELGHSLNFGHSGKVVTGVHSQDQSLDPTCIMGNQGILTDGGSAMCFSGSKTWYTGWYRNYHETVKPIDDGFSGLLVGVDDVIHDLADDNMHSLVVRVKGSNEDDLFVMYQRRKGVTQDLGEDGDTVVIYEQANGAAQSWSRASLGEGESYVQSNWNGGINNLIVQVCLFISDVPGGADTAHILIYVENETDINCKDGRVVPTSSPTSSPTFSPSWSPSEQFEITESPTIYHPTGSPSTISPTQSPTVTNIPTSISEPIYGMFYLKDDYGTGEPITESCSWLQKRPENRKKQICRNRWYQRYSESEGLQPASIVCFETCADFCVFEFPKAVYVHTVKEDDDDNEVPVLKTCQWLSKRPETLKKIICERQIDAETVYSQASEVCTNTCDSCAARGADNIRLEISE